VATGPVRALVLPAEEFHALARRHSILAGALTEIVADRLGGFTHDVLSGKTFFDCSIRRRLGRGGMSVVYEAEHLPTARRVALKMLSHRLVNDAEARALFEREANLIAGFDHPHIIRTFGRFAAFGTYFTILEFAAGESLQETIERSGPLPEADVRAILAQVASALAYAHAQQVLHRDLKPSNIMLGPDGHARLTDFGLAMSLDLLVAETPGRLIGTPQYMSPEQLAGQPLTRAADHFGLACVAYEMLMGQRLFPERGLGALLRRHQAWTSPSFRELCPAASDELCRLLETSLHRDPLERRLDLGELAAIDR
jgi:serine/threonine-protein kinase